MTMPNYRVEQPSHHNIDKESKDAVVEMMFKNSETITHMMFIWSSAKLRTGENTSRKRTKSLKKPAVVVVA